MITAEVIFRTYQISRTVSTGTAFVIDHCGKQYLVTARHVVNGIADKDSIMIFHDNEWKTLNVEMVGIGKSHVDVAVFACNELFVPHLSLEASANNLGFGQQVYFAGFPFGQRWEMNPFANQSFPTPFVKTGILSGFIENNSLLVVDGYNNKGFSGGPLVFKPVIQPSNVFQVAGVVSGYQAPLVPIVDKHGHAALDEQGNPIGYTQENSGLVIAVNIKEVTRLIEANPIGYPLSGHEAS
ncbi:MAG: serine protease [Caldilineaceae bacterium]|nr:serine protease [Caldilineaceae bacterium]